MPARTPTMVVLMPASAIGSPVMSLRTITPPCVCCICTAPSDVTPAVTGAPLGIAAKNAVTNAVALVPLMVAITGVDSTSLFLLL